MYCGRGLKDIGQIYKSPYLIQNGRNYYAVGLGLSSVFKGIFNFLTPLIKKGSQKIGRELLEGGIEVLNKMDGNKNFNELVKEESLKRINNVKKSAIEKLNNIQKGESLRMYKKKGSPFANFSKISSAIQATSKKLKKKKGKITKTNKKSKTKKNKRKQKRSKKALDIFH